MLLVFQSLFLFIVVALARKHHLFVGSYGSSAIYGVEFDDLARSLTYVKNNTTRLENEWLALSYDGTTLYSSGVNGWSSFPVQSPTTIGAEAARTPNVGECSVWQGVFIFASRREPYAVYGTLSCANYARVSKSGNVETAAQVPYNEAVVIYGMAMDPQNQYLYSSDWNNGKIWTHKVETDGSLTSMGAVEGPSSVSAPRTMVVHPSGKTMYVLLEGWNAIALYTLDAISHKPVYTGGTFPLLPDTVNAGDYGAQSAITSQKGTILWASARSRIAGKPGYLTGYKLRDDGWIEGKIFQVTTATSGGRANNLAASPFAEDLVALAEAEEGSISIWRYDGTTAKSVARLVIADSKNGNGCCSEAVWLD